MDTTAQQWLAESKTDLETAQLLFNEKHYNACAFYCQQSGEKALKALLYALDERPWGHSLAAFLERLKEIKSAGIDEQLAACTSSLDKHYTGSRYPDAIGNIPPSKHYNEEIAQEALKCTHQVLNFVTEQMPSASANDSEEWRQEYTQGA